MNVKILSIAALFLSATFEIQAQEFTPKMEENIEQITITTSRKKGSESSIMALQKKSIEVIERIGSTQLSKQGVGDLATAVTKATGTQKQVGTGTIFVRGLGDRSNATTINGLPILSANPRLKNINLSLFKTEIVEYIALEKVYHPRLFGDMAGANVNIVSKEHLGKPYAKISIGSGVNFNNFDKHSFFLNQGGSYFGHRQPYLPTFSQIMTQGYPFQHSLENKAFFTPINSSLNLELGTSFSIGREGKLNLFTYGGFENDFSTITGPQNSYDAQGNEINALNREQNQYETNTITVLNLSYKINPNQKIKLVSHYLHSTEQKLGIWRGFIRDIAENRSGYIRRGEHQNTNLVISQISGENRMIGNISLHWNIGYNLMNTKKPDRTQNIARKIDNTDTYSFSNNSTADNHRYFDTFCQNDLVGDLHADYKLKDGKITLGYQGRSLNTNFEAIQFNFRIANHSTSVNINNFSEFFNQYNYQSGNFDIRTYRGLVGSTPHALTPAKFSSNQQNHSAYTALEYRLSDKFSGNVGLRYDRINQAINWDVQIFGEGYKNKRYNKLLPSLNLKYSLNNTTNLRFAFSKTYTIPMIMETAPFSYDEVNETQYGNPDLKPSDNYNLDLKWEYFPKTEEIISLATFGKYIKNPISRITIVSAANEMSYVNSGDYGYVYGAEFEFRKNVFHLKPHSKLYTFMNASYLKTFQELNNTKTLTENHTLGLSTNFNTKNDRLQGASEFLANINLGWEHQWNTYLMDFTMAYTYISDSLYALGYTGRGNLVDKGYASLDAILKFRFQNGISISISGKNLLNPSIEREQQNTQSHLLVQSFKRGIRSGLSLSYQF